MLDMNEGWKDIDADNEEKIINNVRFVRPKKSITLSLSCQICDKPICTIEDVESLKDKGACEHCILQYYYPNKEKWKNGWRPKIKDN